MYGEMGQYVIETKHTYIGTREPHGSAAATHGKEPQAWIVRQR